MNLPIVDIVIVAVYLVGLLLFGLWCSRFVRTERDYFLAGRNLPFWAIGMSIVVSDIGAIDFVSLSAAGYKYGAVAANMDWIGTMPAILLAAFIFIPYYWRSGVYSVPEYLGRRYNSTVRTIQSLAWTVFLVVNVGAIFWATAGMFETLVGAEPWAWLVSEDDRKTRLWIYILLAAVFTGAYTVAGGLAAVVYTDAVQLVIMFIGALLVVGIGLYHPEKGVGGFSALKTALVSEGHVDHFTLFLPHETKTPFPWTGVFFGLAFVQAPAYFMGNQAIVQRTLGARDEWSAKAGTLLGGILKFCIPFLVVVPGLLALRLFPGLAQPESGFVHLLRDLLPVGVRGIVFAAFLAAMMSSVDSVLTSASTLITRDFYLGFFGARPDDRTLLRLGRIVTLALLVLGVLMAPTMDPERHWFSGIYEAMQDTLAVIQGPTWALLLVGMFWSRASAKGGLSALVVGLASSIGLTLWQKVAAEGSRPFTAQDPFMFVAAISFAVTAVVLVAVSLTTSPKSREDLRGLVFETSLRWFRGGGSRRAAENDDE